MGWIHRYPYSNYHEINLDWIVDKLKRVEESGVRSVNGQVGDVTIDTESIGAVPTSTQINGKALTGHLHFKASDFGALDWTARVNNHLLRENPILTANDVDAVPTSRTVNGKLLHANITLTSEDIGSIPISRTINGKNLATDIILTKDDIQGIVPDSRTINGKNLAEDITLTAGDIGSVTPAQMEDFTRALISSMLYPVGGVYFSFDNTSPALYYGGEWERIEGRFLYCKGLEEDIPVGSVGGEKVHELTPDELPAHRHRESIPIFPETGATSIINRPAGVENNSGAGQYVETTPQTSASFHRPHTLDDGGASADNPVYPVTTSIVGANLAHNNMPPYMAVYAWRRVG